MDGLLYFDQVLGILLYTMSEKGNTTHDPVFIEIPVFGGNSGAGTSGITGVSGAIEELKAKLNRASAQGWNNILVPLPWNRMEADIQHGFQRFLELCSEYSLNFHLMPSPEHGVQGIGSGIPRRYFQNRNAWVQTEYGVPVGVVCQPLVLPVLSWHEPTMRADYLKNIEKIERVVFEACKKDSKLAKKISWVFSAGAFRKTYDGKDYGIDRSIAGELAFRKFIDRHKANREFSRSSGWVEDHSFRLLFEQVSRREFLKEQTRAIVHPELYAGISIVDWDSPELDLDAPVQDSLLEACFSELRKISARRNYSAHGVHPAWVYFGESGVLHQSTDAQRQFLILNSLISVSPQKGKIILSWEWVQRISASFWKRSRTLLELAEKQVWSDQPQVHILAGNPDAQSLIFTPFFERRSDLRWTLSTELPSFREDSQIPQGVFVERDWLVTSERASKLLELAAAGATVWIPKFSSWTSDARQKVQSKLKPHAQSSIQMDLQVSCTIHQLGDGKWICFDQPERGAEAWDVWLNSTIQMLPEQGEIRVSDTRVRWEMMRGEPDFIGAFLSNPDREKRKVTVDFGAFVDLSDLSHFSIEPNHKSEPIESDRFECELPPYAVVAFAIRGLSAQEQRERSIARIESQFNDRNHQQAVLSELPGFQENGFWETFS